MNQPRVIDLKIPLPALISGAVACATFMAWMGWQAAGQTNKMEALIISTQKLEKRLMTATADSMRCATARLNCGAPPT